MARLKKKWGCGNVQKQSLRPESLNMAGEVKYLNINQTWAQPASGDATAMMRASTIGSQDGDDDDEDDDDDDEDTRQ